MKKLSRRALLVSSAATLATGLAGGAVVWPYRPYVWEKFGAGRVVLPPSSLPACNPGTLGDDAKNAMRTYFEHLAQATGFPGLSSQEFSFVVDLKCQVDPSYKQAYEDFAELLSNNSRSPRAFLSNLVRRANDGGGPEAQSLRFVVQEFVSLQYARGGFRALGLSNATGHFGGPEGYRHSVRVTG